MNDQEIEEKHALALMGAENEYYDRASPNYRDNERFSWVVKAINKVYDEKLIAQSNPLITYKK